MGMSEFYGESDPQAARAVLNRALELGVTFLDTADMYGRGENERLVGDFVIDRPTLHVNLAQARAEIASPTPVKDRGWQDALEAIYPLKVNHFRVKEADVTYIDRGPFKPLRLRHLNIDATNIRNVKSKERVYPSDVELDAVVFEAGHVSAKGRADFLAAPNPTFRGAVALQNIELDYFKPITNRYNLEVNKGTLSAEATLESAREFTDVDITTATISGIQVDYIHTAQTARACSIWINAGLMWRRPSNAAFASVARQRCPEMAAANRCISGIFGMLTDLTSRNAASYSPRTMW